MPLYVPDIISDAARAIDDAGQKKVQPTEWLSIYNDVTERMSMRYKILWQDATFDIVLDDRYYYPGAPSLVTDPSALVQLERMQYSATPSDPNSYEAVDEYFKDEVQRSERWGKNLAPDGNIDGTFRYWAHPTFFQLLPFPQEAVADGGLMSYWALARRITTATNAIFEFPASLRLLVREGMMIGAKRRLVRYDQVAKDLAIWETECDKVLDKIEDASNDRRSALRFQSSRIGRGRFN